MHAGVARGNAYSEDCHARRKGHAMSDFCPDGYVRSQDAIVRAAESWFPDKIAALESATAPESQTKPDNNFDAVVRALSQPPIPDAWRHAFEDIAGHTVYRLRNFLHEGKLKAYYFGDDGCHSLSREIWATAQADGVMESGIYWPFGKPTRWHESRPNYSLFLLQSELEALLTEQPAKKRPLPNAKKPELVAALRKLDDLPNRAAQLQALCNMPEFREFTITDALFRAAAKETGPRPAGRKSRR
jgi:hypothetical protein